MNVYKKVEKQMNKIGKLYQKYEDETYQETFARLWEEKLSQPIEPPIYKAIFKKK